MPDLRVGVRVRMAARTWLLSTAISCRGSEYGMTLNSDGGRDANGDDGDV
jgi:hypothetical protein